MRICLLLVHFAGNLIGLVSVGETVDVPGAKLELVEMLLLHHIEGVLYEEGFKEALQVFPNNVHLFTQSILRQHV
jgi:hypothetical protein